MAFRLKLVPDETNINWFKVQWLTFGTSAFLMVASVILVVTMGLNFGIDFRGGTTIRSETSNPIDVGQYRSALGTLGLEDVSISEVFDPAFGPDRHVAQVRLSVGDEVAAITPAELS